MYQNVEKCKECQKIDVFMPKMRRTGFWVLPFSKLKCQLFRLIFEEFRLVSQRFKWNTL